MIDLAEKRLRQLKLEELEVCRRYEAFLPEEFKEEFENRFLRRRDSQTDAKLRKFSRAHILWRAIQRLIVSVKLEPTEWFFNQHQIYDYFLENKFSLSYTNKMIALLNVWGFFICKKIDQPFLPINRPRGFELQRLTDNYYQHKGGKKVGSAPLSPEVLNTVREKMIPEQVDGAFDDIKNLAYIQRSKGREIFDARVKECKSKKFRPD